MRKRLSQGRNHLPLGRCSSISGFILKYAVSILGLPPFFVGSVYSSMLVLYAFLGPFFGGLSDKLSLESKIGKKYGKRKKKN